MYAGMLVCTIPYCSISGSRCLSRSDLVPLLELGFPSCCLRWTLLFPRVLRGPAVWNIERRVSCGLYFVLANSAGTISTHVRGLEYLRSSSIRRYIGQAARAYKRFGVTPICKSAERGKMLRGFLFEIFPEITIFLSKLMLLFRFSFPKIFIFEI